MAASGRRSTRQDDALRKLFVRLDKDDSGLLGTNEIGVLARRFKKTPEELMAIMDTSGDKQISLSEFRRYMTNAVRVN